MEGKSDLRYLIPACRAGRLQLLLLREKERCYIANLSFLLFHISYEYS